MYVHHKWLCFLGPRGPLVEPSISPSTRPAPIFPEFIDELYHCRQAPGTPQTIYFVKAERASSTNLDKNTKTKKNIDVFKKTNKKTETNKRKT